MTGLHLSALHRPVLAVAAFLLLAACTGGGGGAAPPQNGPQPVPGGPDPAVIAAELQRATLPASPRQATFQWELDERGAKFRGRGVARYAAPDRFRLDLFGPRGETYLAAALVDETPRIPAALAERFQLPSPALLWAAVGVVRPPRDARLLGAARSGAETTARWGAGDDVFEYRAEGGVLRSLRRLRRGGVLESVEVDTQDGRPTRAQYRDWVVLRTLTITPESVTDVASFPEDTWSPPGTGR